MTRVMQVAAAAGIAAAASGLAAGQTAGSADETRAIVAEMMADAESRSSLLGAGDAGHDGKFFLAGDGFRLDLAGQIQFRYYANFRDEATGNDFESGFQTRRTRLVFSGHVINPAWTYFIQSDFSRNDGSFTLLDAFAAYKFDNGVKVKWGQFKLPLLREELVSDTKQLAIEKSVTNSAFSQDRSQGIELSCGGGEDKWRLAGAFSDGLNSKNTDFSGAGEDTSRFKVAGEAEYAFTGRFEYLFDGGWKQFEDLSSTKGNEFGAMVGAAAHFQQSENSLDPADVDRDTLVYTVDASIEGDSWAIYGAFIGRHLELRGPVGTGESDFDDFGGVISGSCQVTERDEVYARWDAIFADSDRGLSRDDFHFLTVGYTRFFAGHAAKFTSDIVYSFNDTADLVSLRVLPDSGAGLLGDTEDGEIVLRFQFQVLF